MEADVVILALGVRPETALAESAGLALRPREQGGGIAVDEHMRTSDPSIYAVGDAVSVLCTPVHTLSFSCSYVVFA